MFKFIGKHWQGIVIVFLLVLQFGAGFWCAWTIQSRKDRTRMEQQDMYIERLQRDQAQNVQVFMKTMIMLEYWKAKVSEIEKRLVEQRREVEKQRKWNGKNKEK